MLIRFQNVTRQFGKFRAVDDISFTIEQGEIIGLLGHNGAGKTTIMKLLTGYLDVTNGQIMLDGMCMSPNSVEIKNNIGYLPENCPLWSNMSVIDFLRYQAVVKGIPSRNIDNQLLNVIEKTHLTGKAIQPIRKLSKGYRQRVGVASAILNRPAVIVLDEPTNGLDPEQTLHMRSLIKELAETSTVILSTHILQEVQAICQRVLIIRAGKLVLDKKLSDLKRAKGVLVTLKEEEPIVRHLLKKHGSVRSVELCNKVNNQYQYLLDVDTSQISEIGKKLYESGCEVFELKPNIQNLEELFNEEYKIN